MIANEETGVMINKKKNFFMLIAWLAFVFISLSFGILEKEGVGRTAYIEVVPGGSKLYLEDIDLVIDGWDSYGVTYFFIPSFARITELNYDRSKYKMYNTEGGLLERPQFNTEQEVLVDAENGGKVPYTLGIFQSDNLYTINIVTLEDDPDSITKTEYIPISINMISSSGITEYADNKAMMKGRGNTTWEEVLKKSYDIKLSEEYPLLNETKSDRWVLLANAIDHTKICNKMVLDTARDVGLSYITESDWADVFINGLYYGNYLLCREPRISGDDLNIGNLQKENNEYFNNAKRYDTGEISCYDYTEDVKDISGGYLFSVGDTKWERKCRFYLPSGVNFYTRSPDNASVREMEYLSSYVKKIDDNIDSVPDNIDIYSFSRRFLIEEVFNNNDARCESYFFYKKKGLDTLYAGPCWDYDKLLIWMGPVDIASLKSTLDKKEGLIWDCVLMENENYEKYVRDVFCEFADLWNYVLNERIDNYYDKIQDSVKMDYARWNKINVEARVPNLGRYSLPESNVKYMKYTLCKRLCNLSDKWDIEYEFNHPRINDNTYHKVQFISDNGTYEITIRDGDYISEDQLGKMTLPGIEKWINEKTEKEISTEDPVYEDIVFRDRNI